MKPAPGPSKEYLRLVATPSRELVRLMARGERPDVSRLVGREHRGTNMTATSRLLGLRRFIKGFETTGQGEGATGYNKSVAGADLATPWTPRPQRDGRVAFAPFIVSDVDPEARDNRYLDALLLDYGAVPDPESGIAGRLRDYLVRVEPGSDALLLGRAYLAWRNTRIPVGWFALERLGSFPEGDDE